MNLRARPNESRLSCGRRARGAQGGGTADKKAGQRGNAIPPYLRAPGSFKRMLGGQPRIAAADLAKLLIIPPGTYDEPFKRAKPEKRRKSTIVGPEARQREIAQLVQGAERREGPNFPNAPHAALKGQSLQLRESTDRVDSRNVFQVLEPEPLQPSELCERMDGTESSGAAEMEVAESSERLDAGDIRYGAPLDPKALEAWHMARGLEEGLRDPRR